MKHEAMVDPEVGMSKGQEKTPAPEAEARDDSFYIKLPGGPHITSADAMRTERDLLERLRTQGPKAETLKPLAVFYSRVGQQETAYRHLQTWMKRARNPEELAECLLMCGQLAEQVDQHRSAMGFYREALELKPLGRQVNYFLNNNLAFCLNEQAEYQQAMQHCRRALDIDPSRANAYKNLGVSQMGLGQYAEAAATWLQALHIDVSDPRPLEMLEKLLIAQRTVVQTLIPDIEDKLAECRRAVAAAKSGRFADWARGLTFN
jgi:tetratricopeptide (TPR) repeat protein